MSSLECGVDLVEIKRFTTLDPAIRRRFIHRVFTPAEIELCGDRDVHLAGRFAVKEAVAKALRCGIGPISWQEIETLADENQAPMLILHGQALLTAEELRMSIWSVSITHTHELAMAFVVAASDALILNNNE
jgi:holo-[acyl-carrier protein] synthase